MKHVIATDNAPAAIGPYSQAIKANGFLYISGQLGVNPTTGELLEGVVEQAKRSLENIKAILKESGATPADVCKTTVFLVNIADFQAVNAVYAEVFASDAPARSCVAVATLPKGALIEIEAIAVLN